MRFLKSLRVLFILSTLMLILGSQAQADFLAIYITDSSLTGHILVADGYSAGQTFSGPGAAFDGFIVTHSDISSLANSIEIAEPTISYGAGGTTWDIVITTVDGFEASGSYLVSAGISAGLVTGASSTLDIVVTRQFTANSSPTDMFLYGGGTESVGLTNTDVTFYSTLQSSTSTTPATSETLTIGSYIDPFPDAFSFDDSLVLGASQNPNYWLTLGASFQMNGGDSFGGLQFESDIAGFSSVPEPSSLLLLGLGGAGLILRRTWQSRKKKVSGS